MARITKQVAQKWLGDVPEDKRFWCSNGQVFSNLQELERALEGMSEETFRYHSNAEKNDFASWVQDVIGDDKLAQDLRKSITAVQATKKVAERIVMLRGKSY